MHLLVQCRVSDTAMCHGRNANTSFLKVCFWAPAMFESAFDGGRLWWENANASSLKVCSWATAMFESAWWTRQGCLLHRIFDGHKPTIKNNHRSKASGLLKSASLSTKISDCGVLGFDRCRLFEEVSTYPYGITKLVCRS
jgi:hypothetical protein